MNHSLRTNTGYILSYTDREKAERVDCLVVKMKRKYLHLSFTSTLIDFFVLIQ